MDRLLRVSQTYAGGENHEENPLSGAEEWVIDIEQAEYVGGYRLRLSFSDGQERIVDFESFLQGSLNPLIRKYLDLERFQKFAVERGDLLWDEYELCFPVADLYEGRI